MTEESLFASEIAEELPVIVPLCTLIVAEPPFVEVVMPTEPLADPPETFPETEMLISPLPEATAAIPTLLPLTEVVLIVISPLLLLAYIPRPLDADIAPDVVTVTL